MTRRRRGHGEVSGRLMRRLAEARGRFVTVEALLFALYGDDPGGEPDYAEGVLRKTIHDLRRRLPPGVILTRCGHGYAMEAGWCDRYLSELDDAHVVLARSDKDVARYRAMLAEVRA